jgi:hypothetical protein
LVIRNSYSAVLYQDLTLPGSNDQLILQMTLSTGQLTIQQQIRSQIYRPQPNDGLQHAPQDPYSTFMQITASV